MISVLFVCLGNICRSPMAEGLLKKLIEEENLTEYIKVDSAATSSWEKGNKVYYKTEEILKKEGIDTSNMFSRQINIDDKKFDYIIAMDENNVKDIKRILGNDIEVKMLLEYAGIKKSIADPWYTDNFKETYDEISLGLKYLLKDIKLRLDKR